MTALRTYYYPIPFSIIPHIYIRYLDKQIESGNMKLADEKRALQEISQIKRARRVVENFQPEQDAMDAIRGQIDEVKKQLDDPETKAMSDRFEALKSELDEIKKESDESYANRAKLFEERDNLGNQIKNLLSEKRERQQAYRDAHDKHWAKVTEDRARRAERMRTQRAAEEAEEKLEIAQRVRDEASIPAFQTQIEDCQTLIDFFLGKAPATATLKSRSPLMTKAEVSGVPKLDIRQVDTVPDGVVVRKKKGEDEDNYFIGGKGKKGKKGGASKAISSPADDASPTTPTSDKLNIPLHHLSALLALSIPAPDSQADVTRLVEDLNTKKTWFEANQPRVTAENIAKAEAEIVRLMGKSGKASTTETSTGIETPVSDVAPSNTDDGESAEPAEPAEEVSEAVEAEEVEVHV